LRVFCRRHTGGTCRHSKGRAWPVRPFSLWTFSAMFSRSYSETLTNRVVLVRPNAVFSEIPPLRSPTRIVLVSGMSKWCPLVSRAEIRSSLKITTSTAFTGIDRALSAAIPGRFIVAPDITGSVKGSRGAGLRGAWLRVWSRQMILDSRRLDAAATVCCRDPM